MAHFLTFSTYGTHLPGDERGSTDRHQGRLRAGYPAFEEFAARVMPEPAFRLEDAADRQSVVAAILEVCRHREWRLLALHVRVTHVHGLVQAELVSPARVMGDWKAYSSRQLKARWPDRRHFWTRGGDTRSVRNEVDGVRMYILSSQGEPMEIYDEAGHDPTAHAVG